MCLESLPAHRLTMCLPRQVYSHVEASNTVSCSNSGLSPLISMKVVRYSLINLYVSASCDVPLSPRCCAASDHRLTKPRRQTNANVCAVHTIKQTDTNSEMTDDCVSGTTIVAACHNRVRSWWSRKISSSRSYVRLPVLPVTSKDPPMAGQCPLMSWWGEVPS